MTAMEEPDWASVAQQEMLQVWGSLASLAKPSDAAEKRGNEREEEWRPDKWSRPASKGTFGKGRRWEDWDATSPRTRASGLSTSPRCTSSRRSPS